MQSPGVPLFGLFSSEREFSGLFSPLKYFLPVHLFKMSAYLISRVCQLFNLNTYFSFWKHLSYTCRQSSHLKIIRGGLYKLKHQLVYSVIARLIIIPFCLSSAFPTTCDV